jgi:hypothetical protein
MASSISIINDIASELADHNPNASAEYITEIIVNSLESDPIISEAISHIELPTMSDIKQDEFLSNNLPPKRRQKVLERVENANFFRRLQYKYILPVQDSDFRTSIHRDGARVDLIPSLEFTDRSYQKHSKSKKPKIDKTYESIQNVEDVRVSYLYSEFKQEIPARNAKEVKTSSSQILREIDEASKSNQLISLYKIYQIIRVMEDLQDQDTMITQISEILSDDIKLRNRKFKTNCLDELYRDNDILPTELRIKRPSSTDIVDKIYENLKAIIVHEYKRLYDQYGEQFINGQITYDMYIQKTDRYAMYADRLTSELP